MLYVNEEILDTGNRKEGYVYSHIVKDYHNTITKALEEFGDKLEIRSQAQPRRDPKTGHMRYPGARGLDKRANIRYTDEDGNLSVMDVIYNDAILQKDENQRLKRDNPNILVHRGVLYVDIQGNPDLAYFVLRSGKVGKTKAEGKEFYIHDPVAINKHEAEANRRESKVKYLIFEKLPDAQVRMLAKSFGIGHVNRTKDTDSVRVALDKRLQANERQKRLHPGVNVRGYADFLEAADVGQVDRLIAMCADAEAMGVLVYNSNERRYEIDYGDGKKNYILKELSPVEVANPRDSIAVFLMDNERKLEKLQAVMAGKDDDEKDEDKEGRYADFTIADVMAEWRVPVLRKMLKTKDPEAHASLGMSAKAEHVKSLLQVAFARENQEAQEKKAEAET